MQRLISYFPQLGRINKLDVVKKKIKSFYSTNKYIFSR